MFLIYDLNMYLILKWAAVSGSGLAIWVGLAVSVMAQSTPPPGVTITPTTPDALEQTIPDPSELPRPLLLQVPVLPQI